MATQHKFLLLIISIGLVVGLFSKSAYHYENKTPWNIQPFGNGQIHVFGITPGTTTIQDANLILGHFAEIRLYNTEPPRLIAVHDNIQLGAETATIELEYQLDALDLAELQQTVNDFSPCRYAVPTVEQQIALLNTPIQKIIYTAKRQYNSSDIERQLGKADEIQQVNATQQIILYRKYNLSIYINNDKPDVLVYENILGSL